MKLWEYNTIYVSNTLSDGVPYLDADGAVGWELVYVQPGSEGYTYLMKRELPSQDPPVNAAVGGQIVKHNHSIDRPCRAACQWFGTSNQLEW